MPAPAPVRVVTLIDVLHGGVGGAERVALDIVTGLDRDRFETWLCLSRGTPDPRFAAELEAAGVHVVTLQRRGRADLAPWVQFARLLRRERIDVLHAHKFGSNVWAATVGRLCRVPVVVAHEHTWSFEGQPARRVIDRHVVARGADVVVAVSRQDREKMISVERIPPARIQVIPNGIRAAAPQGADVRAELGIPPGAPVIGNVGVLRPQKAQDVLIEAAALLVRRFGDLRVLIAGGGYEHERLALERLIAARGLDDHVLLLGVRADVPDVLRAVDVAVLSSDFEGMPLAALEYMAAARPVVATAVGALPDVVEDGVTGLLVPRRDPPALAAALERLLEDPARARAMGEAGRRRCASEFDLRAVVRRVEDLYLELLAARRATANIAGPSASRSQSSFE